MGRGCANLDVYARACVYGGNSCSVTVGGRGCAFSYHTKRNTHTLTHTHSTKTVQELVGLVVAAQVQSPPATQNAIPASAAVHKGKGPQPKETVLSRQTDPCALTVCHLLTTTH